MRVRRDLATKGRRYISAVAGSGSVQADQVAKTAQDRGISLSCSLLKVSYSRAVDFSMLFQISHSLRSQYYLSFSPFFFPDRCTILAFPSNLFSFVCACLCVCARVFYWQFLFWFFYSLHTVFVSDPPPPPSTGPVSCPDSQKKQTTNGDILEIWL